MTDTTRLTIRHLIDQDALAFNTDNGITRDEAIALAEREIRARFPDARVIVEVTDGIGGTDVTRTDLTDGSETWQRGDEDVVLHVDDAIGRATEALIDERARA